MNLQTELLVLALILISEKLSELDAGIVHTQHNEILMEAREDIADQVRAIVEKSMEAAFKQIIPEVSFVAKPGVA
jgi:DNA polymerase I-like protein with 3'-5' exonuclease and polymerase domains